MAGKPSRAAPPYPRPGDRRWHRRGLGLLSPPLGAKALPALLLSLLRPGSGTGASLNFNYCRDRAGAGRELIRERRRGSPDRSAPPGSGDSAAPAPSPDSESPQVASGRGGEPSHCCDAAASAGKRRVPGTAPAARRGLRRPTGPQHGGGRCVPKGSPGSPSRGWRARFGEPGPSALSRPWGPGQSGALPRHPETSQLPRGGQAGGSSPPRAPQKVCPGGGEGTHVLRRRRRPLLGLGFQLLDALRLGAGGHCGARAGVLAHAEAASGAGRGCGARPGAPG